MDEKRYIKRKEKALADKNFEQLAVICNYLGDLYNQLGRYKDAVKEYQQEAGVYKNLSKSLEMARAHRMVGEMFMLLSEFENAKEHINIYLKTVKRLQNKVEEQRALTTLGRAYLLHGQSVGEASPDESFKQLKLAEKTFLKSLLLIKEVSGKISKLEQLDMQARCYLNIGVVKEHREEFEESITYIEKALKICKTNDFFELTHVCYISMSLLYHCKKHDSTLALQYCNLALDVAKRLTNKIKKICETLITKSDILIKEADFSSAKQILTKAYRKNTPDENDRKAIERSLRIVVKICKTLDELVTTSSTDYTKRKILFEKLGDGCCHLLNYAKALEYYKKMLECAEVNGETDKQLIPIYVSLYQTYKDNKEYDKALDYLWKEFELNKDEPEEAFSTLCTIADVCELQNQSFWTIQSIYIKAKEQAAKSGPARVKLERIVFACLRKLQLKHKMNTLADVLEEEAKNKGIDLSSLGDDSDTESETLQDELNMPEYGNDVNLEDLSDSNTSDLDETEKPRTHRATRGTRSLNIKRNNKGETPLHQACIAGNIELVRRLLDQGHMVNVRDHAGWLPLHESCNHGFRDIVELLLDRGALSAINDKGGTSCDGITPLYDACSNGFLSVVQLLLERGADATLKTDFGATCLDALDNWRRRSTLNNLEQTQYESVRSDILKRLSKVGICSVETKSAPLTNSDKVVEETDSELVTDNDDSDDSNDHLSRPTNVRKLEMRSSGQSSAGRDYKFVMEKLKRPNRNSGSYLDTSTKPTDFQQKRSALLESEESDSWLIDDVGPEKKKRRYTSPTSTRERSMRSSRDSFTKSTSIEDLPDSENYPADPDSAQSRVDAFDILLSAPPSSTHQRHKQSTKLRPMRNLSVTSSSSTLSSRRFVKLKHQASLLDSGFCRFRSEGSISSEDSTNTLSRTTEPDSTTTSLQPALLVSPAKSSPVKQVTLTTVPSMVSFKIKVEDELLLVPIERTKLNEIDIRWLAEEAARRYYNMVGLKPLLRLKTSDGFAYEEKDPVSVAIEENVILGTVLEWNILPLSQRYEQMCHLLNKEVNADVVVVLEKSQISNGIQLSDHWLTLQTVEPIFKCILHQKSLRVLDFSNNFIQNEGCRQLSKCLHTLKQLKSLNLRGNLITADGLQVLCSTSGIEKLEDFEELNLSQNPLGNNSLRILHKLCQTNGKSLRKLFLSNCSITDCYNHDINFSNLSHFDISYNHLTDAVLRSLLEKLNACRLHYLNLSFTQVPTADKENHTQNAEQIVQFLESGACEQFKHLELCGCHLDDSNMFRIALCLSRSNHLDILAISENPKLSEASFKYILGKLPQLKQILAVNCTHLITNFKLPHTRRIPHFMAVTLNEDPSTATDQLDYLRAVWQSYWGDKGGTKVCGRHVELHVYVNDTTD